MNGNDINHAITWESITTWGEKVDRKRGQDNEQFL